MGDRGEVVLIEGGVADNALPIRLYTHWGASELHTVVANALKRGKGRWGDDSYLNRIIFSEMIKDNVEGETGYGITIGESGDAWRIIFVNHGEQVVTDTSLAGQWTFEEYVETFAE